ANARVMARQFRHPFGRVIAAGVVNDQKLKIVITLLRDRANGMFNSRPRVERGHTDRHLLRPGDRGYISCGKRMEGRFFFSEGGRRQASPFEAEFDKPATKIQITGGTKHGRGGEGEVWMKSFARV